jgi:uncharacterized protein (DUF983 family)
MCFRPAGTTMDTVNCPECGQFNLASAEKCKKCGANLPKQEARGDAPGVVAPARPGMPGVPKRPGTPPPFN